MEHTHNAHNEHDGHDKHSRTHSHKTDVSKFKQLGISEHILSVISDLGFSEPSEIQQKAIPLIVSGKDVIGKSATGSGKTLAFSAGIIDKVVRDGGVQVLVMTPTRELAEQVSLNIRKFSRNNRLYVTEIYGGVSMEPQIRNLRRTEIVVGTPGRIFDHIERRTINLSKVKFLILDEADRMLDMGFIRDVEKIIRHCPKERQTLLFSATISPDIKHIADRHMIEPVTVSVHDQVDPSKLYQTYYDVAGDQKFSLLVYLLRLEKNGVVMVFCNTRRNVEKLSRNLNGEGIHCMAIHGGLSQNRRSENLQAFHDRDTLVLICTDIAARGLDIKDVSHVYNFDIPSTSDDYIHRIGRTARAGKEGRAISFVSSGDHSEFRQICKEKKIEMERINVPDIRIIPVAFGSNADRKMARRGGRSGGRGRSFGGGNRGRSFGSRSREGGEGRGDRRGFRRFEGRGDRNRNNRSSGRARGFRR
jgi:ATP-dependent RNA helicase DeaD